jgi:hypothetical protein
LAGLDNSLRGKGAAWCILGYLAASMGSTYQVTIAPPSCDNQNVSIHYQILP